MIHYSDNTMYSFKADYRCKPEIMMKRVYVCNGNKKVDVFYAERTQYSSIIAIPKSLVQLSGQQDIHGRSGTVLSGDYFMGKVRVHLTDPRQFHYNYGFVNVENL